MLVLGLCLTAHWNRPRLAISIAKALTGSHRVVRNGHVYEYRAVLDLQESCLTWLIEYSAPNDGTLPPSEKPVYPKVVYGVYLENLGRSEITDVRLAFSSPTDDFEITASPQLSLTQSQQSDPNGESIRTVTVASIAPGAGGVVMGTLQAPGGRLTIDPTGAATFDISFDVKQINRTPQDHRHVRFAGSRELSQIPIKIISVNDLFTRQEALFGLNALSLPIDPIELSVTASKFELRGPFRVCPAAPGSADLVRYSSRVVRRPVPPAGSRN